VLRTGTLVVRTSVAVNLDSQAQDWDARQGSWDGIRNFEWDGGNSFMLSGGSQNVAVLAANTPADYTACESAAYGQDLTSQVGTRFCVRTQGGHLALLVVKAASDASNGTLTMQVTVWS